MSDIVERLRHTYGAHVTELHKWCAEAAAEVERLREENNDCHSVIRACTETEERLRAAQRAKMKCPIGLHPDICSAGTFMAALVCKSMPAAPLVRKRWYRKT